MSRRRLTRRRTALLGACAVGVLVPTLALSFAGGAVGLAGVARAAEKTQAAGTATFRVTVEGTSSRDSGVLAGAIDFRVPRAHMTFTGPAAPLGAEMILDGTTVYVGLSGFPLSATGKSWLKFSQIGSDDMQRLVHAVRLLDPGTLFQLLDDAGHFQEIGADDVGAVQTTHYRGAVDIGKLATAFGAPPEALKGHADTQFPVDAWVDGDGYLRKVAFDVPTLQDEPGATVEITFSDFGAPVDVTPPPADQVQDVTGLLKGKLGDGGTATSQVTDHVKLKVDSLPAGADGK
jgi:hypothetical protein